MECKFAVGQKVVCIFGHQGENKLTKNGWAPKTGGIYTVRSIFVWGKTYIRLEEYHDDHNDGPWGECGWDASRFRPAIEHRTDISIFKAMLNPSKEQVSA